jgi:signal transduction histidine kinase
METSGPAVTREVAVPLRRLLWGPERPRPPARRGRWARIRLYLLPIALVGLLSLAFAAGEYVQDSRGQGLAVVILLGVGSVLPVALTAVAPLMAFRVALVMMFLGVIGARATETWPWNPVQILGFLLVMFRVAVTEQTGVTAWATALGLVPVFVFSRGPNAWGAAIFIFLVVLVGDMIARRRQSQRAIAEQEQLTAIERARRAVLEERARIAREMHDVVAHHMSMIAVQAETAPYRVADLPEPARAELATIATAARSALADMRRLLGVLRAEDDPALRAPQPGLGDVPDLVTTATRAGVPVELDMPPADGIPEAVGLAAFRIIQEALANAARHAPGGPVRIAGRVSAGRLELAIRNGPAVPGIAPPPLVAGTGHGVTGMRERATLLGGTLSADRDGDGGYTVAAVLPFEETTT